MILGLWWKDPFENMMNYIDLQCSKFYLHKIWLPGIHRLFEKCNNNYMHMHFIVYSMPLEKDIVARLNNKANVENVFSFYFPINSLCCDCMKWIVSGEAWSRRGNCKYVALQKKTWITYNFEKAHLWAKFEDFHSLNACWQPWWCWEILIRIFYPNSPLTLFLFPGSWKHCSYWGTCIRRTHGSAAYQVGKKDKAGICKMDFPPWFPHSSIGNGTIINSHWSVHLRFIYDFLRIKFFTSHE